MALYSLVAIAAVMATLLQMQLALAVAECPLDLSASNFTLVASLCTSAQERGKCCRYINAFVAISISQYARSTGNLSFNSDSHQVCLKYVSQTLGFYGVPPNATAFCGLGTKIPINYKCRGRATVTQMLQSPGFDDVAKSCQAERTGCRKCITATMVYLRSIIGDEGNVTLTTCRDATFVSLVSQGENISAVEFARCFFGAPRIQASDKKASSDTPAAAAPLSPVASQGPSDLSLGIQPSNKYHHRYHLTVVPSIAVAVTVISFMLLMVLVFVIYKKGKELSESECDTKPSTGTNHHPQPQPTPHVLKIQEGPMLRKFTLKEIKKVTENFTTVIGQGGFGTVYKAQFSDGSIAAIKRINKVSEQADDEICREIELLARLHHRHLVALKGFCIEKQERLLVYEYMVNGSLKDHLHTPGKTPLCWRTRIQIAVNVANALEYLHFYCNPPLCHRDIKSSNILLDENFVAKVADFGLAHASKDGSICFEPINTDVRGTPGYMDPEYVVTRELTEKSDIYSYGVLLLELVTGRRVITDKMNLVEWAAPYLSPGTKLSNLVDPALGESCDFDQLQTLVEIIKWCIHPEGRCRPSMKEVLRLLYEYCLDPMRSGFSQGMEDDDGEASEGSPGGLRRKPIGKGKGQSDNVQSVEGKGYPSSSSTSRSYCSRSFLLEDSST